MRDRVAIVRYTAARVEAAAHDHEAALEHLAACEAVVADAGMRRFALDVHAARARSLDALGRDKEAAAARDRGQELVEGIASSITDEALRSAFLIGSGTLLGPTAQETE